MEKNNQDQQISNTEEEAPTDALPLFAPDMDNPIEPRSDDNDFRDDEFNEEYSAEVATMDNANLAEMNDEVGAQKRNATWGWAGLILAIASLFVWPVLLGPGAAVIGFVALTQGHRALGIWSIVIGLISFMAYIVLVPLYAG